MYLKHLHIFERKRNIFRSLAFLFCVLIIFYFDFPFLFRYERHISSTRPSIAIESIKNDISTSVTEGRSKNEIVHESIQKNKENADQDSSYWNSRDRKIASEMRREEANSEYYYESANSDEDEYEQKIRDNQEPEAVKSISMSEDGYYYEENTRTTLTTVQPGMKEKIGWERNVSCKTLDYIDPEKDSSYSQIPRNACSVRKPFILIMVCSNPRNHILRQAIRRTWARTAYKFYNFTIYFLVGNTDDAFTNDKLLIESNLYRDLIIENFHDTYNNLTLKTIYMFKWVHKHCSEAPYIIKMDDDVYVNTESLYRFATMAQKNDTSKFLVGKLVPNALPYRDDTHKWYMPYYLWGPKLFPNYTHGVGYMMSKEVALKLYQESLKTNFIFLEDVFITGICAKALNITPIDREEFRFNEGSNIDCDHKLFSKLAIVAHKINVFHMYRLHYEGYRCSLIRI